jgi:hypothetical protein
LGLWLAETEGAKFWLSCLTDLQNRGLTDIFVACIDGLAGFAEAIHTAYPRASVQLCLVHLVRAALRYVSTQDSQAVARDLKRIYQAATVIEAEEALASFAQAWDAKLRCLAFSGQSNSLFCKEEEGRSNGTGKAAAKGSHTAFVLGGVQAGSGPDAPGWALSAVGGGAAGTLGTECPI